MNNILKSKWNLLLLLVLAVFQLAISSCKETEEGMGTPEITGVRVCDPAEADSLFTKSAQGQMIAIIGTNLADAQAVYINGQKVSFSTTMNTDHSIIVTVPTEDDDNFNLLTNTDKTIRVVTSHGEASYDFTVLAQSPSISRIQGTYPRQAGDSLKIYGYNIFDIEKMYFTDATTDQIAASTDGTVPGNHVDVSDFSKCENVRNKITKNQSTYYQTTSKIGIVTPNLAYDKGTLVIETGHGTTYIAYSKTPGVPVITYMSSDMPEVGETLTITGREFVQVSNVTYGDVSLTPDEFIVSESEDSIIIPFVNIPSVDSNASLSITTPGGTTTTSFYDRDCLLTDLDGDAINLGWDPNIETLATTPYGGTGNVAHFTTFGQWWGQMFFFANDWNFTPFTLPSYDKIPRDASADDVYLACEVYDDNSDFNNGGEGYQGFLRVHIWGSANNNSNNNPDVLFHNFAWDDYEKGTFKNPYGPILQDINGEAHKGKWYRAIIKLSDFCLPDDEGNPTDPINQAYKTYGDFVDRGVSIMRIMSYTQGTQNGNVNVYVDNIRLYYNKK